MGVHHFVGLQMNFSFLTELRYSSTAQCTRALHIQAHAFHLLTLQAPGGKLRSPSGDEAPGAQCGECPSTGPINGN